MKGFLTAQEVTILKESHYDSVLRKKADRIKAILLLNDGLSYDKVAQILMLDDTTVRRYEGEYQKTGIDGLLEDHYQGSKAFLTVDLEKKLAWHLKRHTYQTVKEVAFYVQKKYAVSYSVEGMTHLLHKLGFVYKKTKRVPGKLDQEKQKEFKKQYEEIKATKNPQDKIYFLDATHPQHNNMPFYGWIFKGKTKTIKGNTGRKRINLNGALNIEDLTVTVLEEPTINTTASINLLTEIEKRQKTGVIYAIIDNASYFKSYEFKDWLKSHPRIKPVPLPSYSPNLNIIERLWLFFQKKKLYGHYYATFKEFKETCLDFFDNIQIYRPELATLLTDSFQKIPA